jgi:hypothetical protein
MSLRHVTRKGGGPATLDDMSPASRAFGILIEHIGRRRAVGLDGPCLCDECEAIRLCLRGEPTGNPDNPGEFRLVYTPPEPPR